MIEKVQKPLHAEIVDFLEYEELDETVVEDLTFDYELVKYDLL